MPWVAVQTHPCAEARAKLHIERQDLPCYLPRFRADLVVRGRLVTQELVLFPRYIFVWVVDRWRCLLGTSGVSRVVMAGEHPAMLRDRELEKLRAREDRDGFVVLEPRWKEGQEVRITSGPFSEFQGLYEGMTGRERVHVLLRGLHIGLRVEVSERDLVAA